MGCLSNPSVLKLLTGICLAIIDISLVVILEVATRTDLNGEYICTNKSMIEEGRTRSCWEWRMNTEGENCPFNLMFVALLIFLMTFLVLLVTVWLKKFYSGFAGCIQRRLCCRWVSHYLQLGLNMSGTAVLLGFIVMVLTHTEKQPCFQVADMLNNCTQRRSLCWMFAMTCVSFTCGLLASLFSGWDAAHLYRKLNDEEREKLYQRYVDYSSTEDINVRL